MGKFHIIEDGKVSIPYSKEELLLKAITPDMLVWHPTLENGLRHVL